MAQLDHALAARMAAAGRAPLGYRKNGRPIWPMFGAEDAPPEGAPAGEGGGAPKEGPFPANTPLEQMTVEQREAYWKDKARKHEDRVRAFGKTTPEEVADLRAKAEKQDALEFELSSEADKRAAEARKEAAAEADAKYLPRIAEAEVKAAAAGKVDPDALAKAWRMVDKTLFVKNDGSIDADMVAEFVSSIAPVMGSQQQQQRPGPSSSGQGHRAPVVAKPGEAGRLAAMRRGYIPAS